MADAATDSRVEVMGCWALVRLAKATACVRVEVETAWAVLMDAEATAFGLAKPLVASRAGLGLANAATAFNVPGLVLWAIMNQAFEGALRNVPGVAWVV